jgi:hypothetical protein
MACVEEEDYSGEFLSFRRFSAYRTVPGDIPVFPGQPAILFRDSDPEFHWWGNCLILDWSLRTKMILMVFTLPVLEFTISLFRCVPDPVGCQARFMSKVPSYRFHAVFTG